MHKIGAKSEFGAMQEGLSEAIAEVQQALKKGEWIAAVDLASQHLKTFPDDERLRHRAVLGLARAGATERAMRLFHDWNLGRSDDTDVLALEGRLLKDLALKLSGAPRRAALLDAAAVYKRVFDRRPGYYPAINWTSLTFLGGRKKEAARIAARVLADPEVAAAKDFWALATRAEANVLLGRLDAARADLNAARAFGDEGAGSSTRRQLRLVLSEAGHTPAKIEKLLAPLAPRLTVHYLGATNSAGLWKRYGDGPAAAMARERIGAALKKLNPGALVGSLGTPGEILLAEAALAAGRELNVMLPLPPAAFVKLALKGAGRQWRERFAACCANAHRLGTIAEDPDSDDPTLGDYSARVAMGLALQRAQNIDGGAAQLVLTDSAAEGVDAGAAAAWTRDKARRQVILALGDAPAPAQRKREEPRQCCAVIFGDLPGFSKMPEKFLPIFWDTVMRAIGDVVAESGEAVALKNTWGDAIHLVVPDVRSAAGICLTVQKRLATIDGSLLGREEAPTMRIGAHYGPVFADWDPVVGQHTYYGRALSRAARIEPITPPGTVYVTEAFAAILLLETRGEFTCTYVGQVPLAKGYGTFRMYEMRAEA